MPDTPVVPPPPGRPSRVRFVVLAMFCALAALSYLDRICIREVQRPVETALRLGELSPDEIDAVQQQVAEAVERGEIDSGDSARAIEKGLRKKTDDRARERMSWVFSAFTLGYLLFEIPGGWLGDRWGVRWMLTQIVLFWSLFTALTGSIDAVVRLFFADPGWPLLMAAMMAMRFLFGLAAAGAFPVVGRGMGLWFPAQERATATGVIWLFTRVGGALTPFLFGYFIILAGGWRQAFWLLGGVGVLWAAWFVTTYRDRPEDAPGINDAELARIRSGRTVVGHGHEMPLKLLFGSANLWAFYWAVIALNFCWYFYLTFLPKYLIEAFGVVDGSNELKLMLALPFVFGGVGCLIGGWLSDRLVRSLGLRRGRSRVALIAYLGAATCWLLVPSAVHLHLGAWGVVALFCLIHALQDLSVPVVWALPAEIGGRHAGSVGGAQNAMGGVGALAGPVVVAYLVSLSPATAEPAARWNVIFYLFAGLIALGSLSWLRVNAEEPLEPATRGA
jgi:ACS family glucarate transporter-like MFS transporter